jgi:integron integrase
MFIQQNVKERNAVSLTTDHNQAEPPKPQLLDQVRNTLRRKHHSIRTEQSYIDWIKRFIYFHDKQHPRNLSEHHVTEFLNFLAVQKRVASSTQNQALCALVFLYREVIKKDLAQFEGLVHAKRPARLPVVFTHDEIRTILLQLDGVTWIMGKLLYGAGLRVMECVRLRVKDVDFGYKQITVRDGKGHKDRVTMLPEILTEPLSRHLEKIKKSHEIDLQAGFGTVYLPYALERKYPNANRSWSW